MTDPFEFEGDEVTDFKAQLPSATLEAPEAYPRGTLLTLTVQVRVKSVRIEEDRSGQLSRKHILSLEDVTVTDVLTPAQRKALIDAAAVAAEQVVASREPGSYTVPEEFEPQDDALPGQTTIEDHLQETDDQPKASADDDDAEHSWMDEEEDGLHVDLSALV